MDTVILGASGLVGSALVRRFGEEGLDVLGTYYPTPTDETNTQIDVTNEQALSKLIADCDPDIVINAAAFVDVDACELERNRAWAVNVTGTRNAAAAAAKADAHFIYISTDYVFGGGSNEAPYVETDPPCPINYYGATKRAGEQVGLRVGEVPVVGEHERRVLGGFGIAGGCTVLVELDHGAIAGALVEHHVQSHTADADARRGLRGLVADGIVAVFQRRPHQRRGRPLVRVEVPHRRPVDGDGKLVLDDEVDLHVVAQPVARQERRVQTSTEQVQPPGLARERVQREVGRCGNVVAADDELSHIVWCGWCGFSRVEPALERRR